MRTRVLITLLPIIFCVWPSLAVAELNIPASTAYLNPEGGDVRISKSGISRWNDANTQVVWFGNLKHSGEVKAKLKINLPVGQEAALQLSVNHNGDKAAQSQDVTLMGTGQASLVDFGAFQISKIGYTEFRLKALKTPPAELSIQSLTLDGSAAQDAHFNLKPRRNAASVHLSYPMKKGAKVSAFYCEMTGLQDPIWSYYMACGWHRGYFGMQVNSPTERRIIFSVWDSGNEGIDRDKVKDENRVTLVKKGEGVFSGDFGNEGTGGHSHLKFLWKTGQKQRFLVTAEPVSKTQTVYAGYYFRPDKNEWMLISSWKAPKEGGYMRGLYSFSENFVGRNGHVVRKALYGNQWIRLADGSWHEITTAKFSHDSTGKSDRLDRFMGLERDQFFLSHGGFIDGYTKFGTPFERPASNDSPEQMHLPGLPEIK